MNEVVSTIVWEGEVYIFTACGDIYRMLKDHTGGVVFQKLVNLFPE